MIDKEIHLRGAALNLCDHLPIDHDDALKVLDYARHSSNGGRLAPFR